MGIRRCAWVDQDRPGHHETTNAATRITIWITPILPLPGSRQQGRFHVRTQLADRSRNAGDDAAHDQQADAVADAVSSICSPSHIMNHRARRQAQDAHQEIIAGRSANCG